MAGNLPEPEPLETGGQISHEFPFTKVSQRLADRDHDGRLTRAETERMCSHLAGKANVFTVSHPVDRVSRHMPPFWQS